MARPSRRGPASAARASEAVRRVLTRGRSGERGARRASSASAKELLIARTAHRHQRVQAEGLVRGERGERGRAAEVADETAGGDGSGGGGDLAVGHGEQDDVCIGGVGAAAQRGVEAERGTERAAHSSAAHDRAAQGRGLGVHLSVQLPKGDAGRDLLVSVFLPAKNVGNGPAPKVTAASEKGTTRRRAGYPIRPPVYPPGMPS